MMVYEAIVPSPASGTGSQARWPHESQNSLGGIASLPHAPHLMAVNAPSRTRSKKSLSVITGSITAEQAHQHGGGVAAQRVGETDAGAVHLACAGLAAKLGDDLHDLRGAGGADGMALGLEPAGCVDRNLSAEARPPLLGRRAARAELEEAEPFRGDDLGDREAVV